MNDFEIHSYFSNHAMYNVSHSDVLSNAIGILHWKRLCYLSVYCFQFSEKKIPWWNFILFNLFLICLTAYVSPIIYIDCVLPQKKLLLYFLSITHIIGNRYYRECMETAFVLSLPLPYCIGLRRYSYDCLANLKL